eukprot:gene53523-14648_t
MLAIGIDLSGDPPFDELLRRGAAAVARGLEHARAPFADK